MTHAHILLCTVYTVRVHVYVLMRVLITHIIMHISVSRNVSSIQYVSQIPVAINIRDSRATNTVSGMISRNKEMC